MNLNHDFFKRDSIHVAKMLLGNYFIKEDIDGMVVGKIVETEAYRGEDDLACHASHGRTKRTEGLYGEAGRLYIYLNYGIFYLTNIVCGEVDDPSAVLIRSAEIIKGQVIAKQRLEANKFVKANQFSATGPGKFSVAFNITKPDNGINIADKNTIYIKKGNEILKDSDIIKTTRIGVDYAKHCKDYPWRFYIKDNKFVSKVAISN